MIQISLLAPKTTVTNNGIKINFPTKKCRGVFTYLLLNKSQCTRNRLANIFWEDYPEERARRNLNNTIWLLKKLFEEKGIDIKVNSNRSHISLQISKNIFIDIESFYSLVNQAQEEMNLPTKISILEKALSIGNMYMLQEEDDIWLEPEKQKFNNTRKQMILEFIKAYKSSGDYEKALELSISESEKDPLDEALEYEIILLLYLSGKKNEAILEYQRFCKMLKDELEVAPAQKIITLINTIIQDNFVMEQIPDENHSPEKTFSFEDLPLIGRKTEISKIRNHLLSTLKNQTFSCVIIKGRAGIGKSRLLEELKLLSHFHDTDLIELECNKLTNPPAFNLVTDLIKKILNKYGEPFIQALPTSLINVLTYFIPDFHRLISNSTGIVDLLNPNQFEFRIFYDGVCSLVKLFCKENPLVIMVDDIHLADKESLALFNYLFNELKDNSIMFIQTIRTEDISESLRQYTISIKELTGRCHILELNLEPLTPDSISQLILNGLKITQNDLNIAMHEFVQILLKETGGNPLFILETLRYWRQKGILAFDKISKRWSLDSFILPYYKKPNELPNKIDIPDKLNHIYQARLSQLDKLLVDIIQAASVIGYYFDKELLQHIIDISEETIIFAFDLLIAEEIVIESKHNDLLRFSHIKLREFVYNSMSKLKRRYFHKKIYQHFLSLQNSPQDQSDLLTQLAWHSYQADKISDSIKFNLLSGISYQNKGIAFMSLHYFDRALEIFKSNENKSDYQTLISIYKGRGKTNFFLGDGKQADQDLKIALRLSQKQSDQKSEGEILALLAQLKTRMGNFKEALEYVQKAVAKGRELIEMNVFVEILFTMSLVSFMTNNLDLARIVHDDLTKIIEQLSPEKDIYSLGRALFAKGQHLIFTLNQVENSITYFENAEKIFRHLNDEENLAIALSYLGLSYFFCKSNKKYPKIHQESLNLAKKTANIHVICTVLGPIITTDLIKGHYGEALKKLEEYPTQGSNHSWMIPFLAVKGELYFLLGNTPKAVEYLNDCLERCKEIEIIDYKTQALATLGLIKASTGVGKEGMQLIDLAIKESANIPFKFFPFQVLLKKMFLAYNDKNYKLLKHVVDCLSEISATDQLSIPTGWVYYGQGIVAMTEGDLKKAQLNFIKALNITKNKVLPLNWRTESCLGDLSLIELDLKSAKKHYRKALKSITLVLNQLLSEELKESFLHRPEINKIILLSHTNLAETYFKNINNPDMLSSLSNCSQREKSLFESVGKLYGKVRRRQVEIARLLMLAETINFPLKSEQLASLFDVNQRTIRRDLKYITAISGTQN